LLGMPNGIFSFHIFPIYLAVYFDIIISE